jgi:hypothetical protein
VSFEEYFKAIGIKEPIQKRIEYLFGRIKTLFPDVEFTDVSISEYVDSINQRQFESIRFYSNQGIIVKAHNFLFEEKYVLSHHSKNLNFIQIETKNYDFKKANANSRIFITGTYGPSPSEAMDLKGSAENCDYLLAIYKKYFLTRMNYKK